MLGQAVVQACSASYGPTWLSRRPDARRALRWSGFAPSSGGAGDAFAECMPFLVLLFAAAARLFAHRRTAAKLAEAYEGLPEGAADADEAEAHARIFFETREGGRERGDRSGERFDDARRTSLATLACALVAGASAPSLLALPYVVFCAFCALAHGLETHGALTPLQTRRRRNEAARRRAGGGGGGSGASGNSLGERSRPLAGFSFLRRGGCLLYTSPSPRDATLSRMPSSA